MLRVIIVDDEALTREALSQAIDYQALGYELAGCAKNGMEAYDIICDELPDVVITDIKMPILNGLELIERVRFIDSDIAFIILSGYGEFEYAKKAIRYGVTDYLLKPVSHKELADTLKRIRKSKNKDKGIYTPEMPEPDDYNNVEKLKKYVELYYYKQELSLKWLSQNYLYLNAQYLSKLFVKKEGQRFSEYLNNVRMEKSRQLLIEYPDHDLRSLAAAVGFGNNPGYFGQVFKKYTGMTPGQYAKQMKRRED